MLTSKVLGILVTIIWLASGSNEMRNRASKHTRFLRDYSPSIFSKHLAEIIHEKFTQFFHLVMIFKGFETEHSRLPQHMTRVFFESHMYRPLQRASGVVIVESNNMTLGEILKNVAWTASTKFMIFEYTKIENDNFYIEDLNYQNHYYHKNAISSKDILNDFPHLVTNDSTSRPLEKESWDRIKNYLNEFWAYRIQHVAIFAIHSKNAYVYTHFPFSEHNCPEEIRPVLSNIWLTTDDAFYKDYNLYPEKINNLFKCSIRFTVVETPPSIIYRSKTEVDGVEGMLLKEVIKKLNGTAKYDIVSDGPPNISPIDIVLENILNGYSDIGAGFLTHTTSQSKFTDDVRFGVTVCLSWAVPHEMTFMSAFMMLFQVFPKMVWFLIMFLVFLSIVIYWLISGTNILDAFRHGGFKIFSLFLGKPIVFPENLPLIFLLNSLLWFSLFLGTIFQAAVGSNAVVFHPGGLLRTTEDILASGYEIVGSSIAKHLLEDRLHLNRTNGERVQAKHMEILNALLKVAYGKQTVYLGLKVSERYTTLIRYPELRGSIFVNRDCLLFYHPFIALKESSPFTDNVAQTVHTLVEGGFVDYEMKELMTRGGRNTMERTKKRYVTQFDAPRTESASVVILIYGLALSVLIFMVEHVCFYVTTTSKYRNGESTK